MPSTRIPGATTAPELDGYLAVPPVGQGPWPGVVVVHEIFGLNDDTRQQADRLAAAGFLAVAPNLFTAGGAIRCLRTTFRSLLKADGPTFGDLEAARSWLAARPDCTGRVGIIGFCMGGGFALLAAPRGFDVAAPNYGPLPQADLETVLRGACPVVASYGGRDRGLPGAAAKVERVLTDLGVDHDVKEYPDAGHSFLNRHNTGPFGVLERVAGLAYHHPSAEDAWARILTFFDRHLRAAA
jgi:carboxymethylenebutenolidase